MNPLSAAFSFLLKPFIHHLDRPAMAKHSGNIALAGLRRPVKVIWQSYGVPHVFAEDESDLFFAQGYLHAQERLWQMESMRLFLSGRLSEIFGEYRLPWRELGGRWRGRNAVDFDRYMRLIGLHAAAMASEEVLPDQQAEHLNAYSSGINRYIEACDKKLPWEFRLLRWAPQPWRPVDSVLVAKGLALLLSTALYTRLNTMALAAHLAAQAEKLRALWPGCPNNSGTITSAVWDSVRELWAFTNGSWIQAGLHAAGQGSNNWTLGSNRSSTGHAILCNDPHLRFGLPSMFYLMHLCAQNSADQGGGFEVWGASIPGLPYIQLGHNQNIAWGVTAALCDDVDLYREKIHRLDQSLYSADGRWRRMTKREEIIAVRNKAPVTATVRTTCHGPVISDFGERGGNGEVVTLRWTAQEASQEFRAAYGINCARTWDHFLAAITHHTAPTLNYLYADRNNNIGYALAGKIPLRNGETSLVPRDGWDSANNWRGFIPFESLPRLFNPPEGACATANNQIVDARFSYSLPQFHEPPHRIHRIAELLNADERLSITDMAAIQTDVVSLHARSLIECLESDLRLAGAVQPELTDVVERLIAWDGECSEHSVAAAVFHVFHHRLMANLLAPTLGDDLFRAYVEILNQCIEPLDRIFADPKSIWFAERSRPDLVTQSLKEACAELRARCGRHVDRWTWGRVHRLTLKHAFGSNPVIGAITNLGPIAGTGDGMTVNAGFYRHSDPYDHVIGPALRMVIDTGAFERSGFILPSGQSGHPGSPHYQDQLRRWLGGKLISFAIAENTELEHCLIISPC